RHAADRRRVPGGDAGARRRAAVLGLRLEGGDSRRRLGGGPPRTLRAPVGDGVPDRVLHVPRRLPHVLRRAGGRRPSPRPARRHDGPAVDPGGPVDRGHGARRCGARPHLPGVPARGDGRDAPSRAPLAHALLRRARAGRRGPGLPRIPAPDRLGRVPHAGARAPPRLGGAGLRARRALRRPLPERGPRLRARGGLDRPVRGRRPGERGERRHAAGRRGPPPDPDRPRPGLSVRRDGGPFAGAGALEALGVTCPVLGLVTVTPLAAAVLIMLIGRTRPLGVRVIAVTAAALTLALSLYIYFTYDVAAGGFQFRELYPLVPALGISVELGADGMSVLMILLTAIIIFAGAFASWTVRVRDQEFYALLLTLVTGVFGVFVSLDLFVFFLFYEIAVLPMYLLIGIWGSTGQVRPQGLFGWAFRETGVGTKEYAAMKLTLYLLLGSAFILVGLFALYAAAGANSFSFLDFASMRIDPTLQS